MTREKKDRQCKSCRAWLGHSIDWCPECQWALGAGEPAIIKVVCDEWARRWYDSHGTRVLANGNLRAAIKTLREFRLHCRRVS